MKRLGNKGYEQNSHELGHSTELCYRYCAYLLFAFFIPKKVTIQAELCKHEIDQFCPSPSTFFFLRLRLVLCFNAVSHKRKVKVCRYFHLLEKIRIIDLGRKKKNTSHNLFWDPHFIDKNGEKIKI